MTPERWKQIEEVFQTALDLPVVERRRYIAGACRGDETLREQVEALVAQHEEAGEFIEQPALDAMGIRPPTDESFAHAITNPVTENFQDPAIGRRIGSYRIVREIGRGGMGAVYLAERDDREFRLRVAVKLIKRGMDTDFILRRFRNERQILASLDHPNIARLLDGGTTEDGLPYFVMEYIEGLPVYRYCDERKLTVRERLTLFLKVCDALHYAHRNLVIHRDIKPSNILVTADGTPKLLDFGIAKVLNPEIADAITLDPTATAMRLMTPEYASPEQVQGHKVTPTSDVYSMGVLLYELLTGHRPYRLRNRAPHDVARVICEEEPANPSARITSPEDLLPAHPQTSETGTLNYLYWSRNATVESLRRELSGDLDNIVMKALRKEPSRRYQTAEELRDDITRYLEGRPVSAPKYLPAPVSPRAPVSVAEPAPGEKSIAVLPFKLMGARETDDTGDEYLGVGLADALITRLSGIRRFVVRPTSSVLRYGDAGDDPLRAGEELGVEYVVDGHIRRAGDTLRVTVQLSEVGERATRWAGRFDQRFTDVLQLEDSISGQIASALIPRLSGEEQEQLSKRGTDNPEAYQAYLRGRYHWHKLTEEGFARAFAEFNRAVALDPGYALAHAGLAVYHIFLGIFGVVPFADSSNAAAESARRAVELDPELSEAHAALGFAVHCRDFDWEGAEILQRRAIELNPHNSMAHNWYSFLLLAQGRFDEAEVEVHHAVELDPMTPLVTLSLAWVYYHTGRFDEALPVNRRVLEIEPRFPYGRLVHSWSLMRAGKREEAVDEAERALENAGDRGQLYVTGLGAAYAAAGRRADAQRILERLREMAQTEYVSPYFVAIIHVLLGDEEKALLLLEEAVRIRDAWVVWLGVEPRFDPLRTSPRFQALVERTGNPLATGRASGQERTQPTVAVLPFKLLDTRRNGETGEDYLGLGLADAVITRLSNVRRFTMRPTSSVMRFQVGETDPLRAGSELGVEYVVDGNIRRAGDTLRVTVQLLNVREGATRWAARFDERSADVLQLEDSISAQVAEALLPHLSGDERERLAKRGTDNPEAYDAYMRGRYHWNTFSEDGLAKALVSYSRAVALDPDYALAHAGIADYYNLLGVYTVLPTAETSAAAKEAALRAVALDQSLAEGYAALGFATLMKEFEWETTADHLRRAIELNPNYVTGRLWYSYFLGMTGQFDGAITEARRALDLAPLTPFVRHTLSWAFYHARRFAEAEVAARKLAADEPRYGLAHLFLCSVLRHTGDFDEAVQAGLRAVRLIGRSPYTLCWLASAHASAGQRAEAVALLDEVRDMSATRYVSPYLLAAVHANLGDRDRSLAELNRALEIKDGRLVWLGVDPQFDSLRPDSEFADVLRRTGNPIFHTKPSLTPPPAHAPAPARIHVSDSPARAVLPMPGHSSDVPHRSDPPSRDEQPRQTEDEEAHKLYVAGRYFATRRTADGLRQAITRFERAVERDPKFALAYAEMADCYALLNWYVEPPPAGAWARAREAALKAAEADDTLAEAHASLGFVLCHYDRDWPRAEAEFRRAIELKPDNPVARRWHALNLSAMGRHGEAVAEIRRAQVVSPRSPVIATAVAIVLFYAQRYDEAVEQCLRALEIDPGSLATHIVLRWSYEAQGMCEEALAIFEQEAAYAGDTPTTRAKHAHVLASCGRKEESRAILHGLIERREEQWVTAYEIAVIYSLLGERDEAFAWLARAEEEHAVGLTYIRVDPRINDLRSDPRFVEVLRRANDPRARLGDDATRQPHDAQKRVAVLPFKFVNPSPNDDTGDAYLGVGLADALITRLSNIRSLTVRPTSAVTRFQSGDTDPSDAGRALGVGYVLDGRVLRAGQALRVTVQLVRVGERAPVWAEKFDEAEADILRLQDSISEKVAAALVPRITEGELQRVAAHGTDNPRAYEAVLRGRYYLGSPDEGALSRAHKAFSEAIAFDPNYALAHAGLADYHNWRGVYGVRPSAECLAEAKKAATRAVQLDPELAEGYAALNFVAVGLDWDWTEAERLIKKSIELNPNYATAHNFYCIQLGAEGRFEEMERAGLRGLESDPLSAHLHQSIGWGFYHARRFAEAVRHLDRSLELDPNFVMARWVRGWTLAQTGEHKESVAELERAVLLTDRQSVPVLAGLATVQALAGNEWEALNILAELQKMAGRRHVSPYFLALVTNVLGEQERALAHLEAAYAQREAWLIWLRGEPQFDSLRTNPRFRRILDDVHPPHKGAKS